MIALDTNILIRHVNDRDPEFPVTVHAVQVLHARGESPCIFPQNVCEFWASATRPRSANGLGLSVAEAADEIRIFKKLFLFVPDSPTLHGEWESVVVIHSCHGRISYDARIVAAMNTHGIRDILTFNASDFRRFPHINILDPNSFVIP